MNIKLTGIKGNTAVVTLNGRTVGSVWKAAERQWRGSTADDPHAELGPYTTRADAAEAVAKQVRAAVQVTDHNVGMVAAAPSVAVGPALSPDGQVVPMAVLLASPSSGVVIDVADLPRIISSLSTALRMTQEATA